MTSQSFEEHWTSTDGPITRQVTAIIVGAGQRGSNYAAFATDFPSRLKIMAVAEPIRNRREEMKKVHNLPDHLAIEDWTELVAMPKMADFAFICTQDRMHKDPAIAFAALGYHLLLEKPMSVYEKECEEIAEACEKAKVILAVCHVLRYFPPCIKIRDIITSGELGQIVTINHSENITGWGFAHSYVRGNWRNEALSSFSLLAKCCHDIDLIMYWMGDQRCKTIQSFGGLFHFKASQKPKGAAERCFECPVEKDCFYSVQKSYLDRYNSNERPRLSMLAVCDIEDDPRGYKAALTEALQTGPYGRCVYACDNDVADHQMVNMEFEDGATASMTMNAFTRDRCRETRICGTKGELRWDGSSDGGITVYDFATRKERSVLPDIVSPSGTKISGHGGADFFLVNAFTKAVASGDVSFISTGIKDSLRSHKLVFAAERSRINSTIEYVEI